MAVPLDARLSMLAALTPACPMAADIGADHGFLGVALLESGRAERVQFLDISEKSLRKARRLVARSDLGARALFAVGDGAEAMPEAAQAAVIAGMGGVNIAQIIERGRKHLGDATLILQPNLDADHLRARLEALGYRIVREDIARSGGRFYIGIAARPGIMALTECERLAGPELIRNRHPLLEGYAAFRMRVLKEALAGAQRGASERAEGIRAELDTWREIARWLSG